MYAKSWTFAFAGIHLATVAAGPVEWISSNANQVPMAAAFLGKQTPAVRAEERTIYQLISTNPDFTNFTKAIHFSEGIVNVLNDTSAGVTFFAVPDSDLHNPQKRHHEASLLTEGSDIDLTTAISLIEEHELDASADDDDEKKRRKEIFRKIVTAILSYHILPHGYQSAQLSENSTFATHLKLSEGSFDGQPLRLKVSTTPITHEVSVNVFSKVVKADLLAKNGVMHILDHPILPPASIFQELFLFPSAYSYFTTVIQRTALTSFLERRWVSGKDGKKGSVEGATASTVFAPTTVAFESLPFRLRTFLFSPFGERVLGKLLAFHVVPDTIVFSDYDHGVKSDAVIKSSRLGLGHETPFFEKTLELPTLLKDEKARGGGHIVVHVTQYKTELPVPIPGRAPNYTTNVFVNGQKVTVADIPARNGAVHSIDKLLNPCPHHGKEFDAEHEDGDWAGWEEWLVEWADQV